MTDRISGAWLQDPRTIRVMAALEAARPGGARFVGGCVRNALLGRPVDDVDIATQLKPEQTLDALKAAGIRAIPTGIDHGTITALVDGQAFEITSLRKDVETDGRRAVVTFTEDWREDACRRDFRLNALYADGTGQIYAPIEGALEDARSGRIVFIGDAAARIREDYLRILRFFRFNAWYGQAIDPTGLAACTVALDRLNDHVAAERRWVELTKLLSAPDPSGVLTILEDAGFLEVLFGEQARNGVTGLVTLETRFGMLPDPVRRLMAVIQATGSSPDWLSRTYRPSNLTLRRLRSWLEVNLEGAEVWTGADWRRALYRFSPEAVCDACVTRCLRGGETDMLRRLLGEVVVWQRPTLPVSGNDLLARGLRGPVLGGVLQDIEQRWVESDFILSREALLSSIPA